MYKLSVKRCTSYWLKDVQVFPYKMYMFLLIRYTCFALANIHLFSEPASAWRAKRQVCGGLPPARAAIGYFHVPPVISSAARNPLVTLDVAGGRFLAALEMTGRAARVRCLVGAGGRFLAALEMTGRAARVRCLDVAGGRFLAAPGMAGRAARLSIVHC